MKILHFSDLHGDIESLIELRKYSQTRSDLELILFSGDLLGQCLEEEQARKMYDAFYFIKNTVKTQEPVSFDRILGFLMTSIQVKQEHRNAAEFYIEVQKEFDENAEISYKKILDEIKQFSQQILMIPGNWDSLHFLHFFGEYDLHEKSIKNKQELKIAGYGSSDAIPVFLPPTRAIPFSHERMYEFLRQRDADVVLTHMPPYSILDSTQNGSRGSLGCLAYLRTNQPDLLLCGHYHSSIGNELDEPSGTVVINSGNLGRYGKDNYGNFSEMDYNQSEGAITNVTHRKIKNLLLSPAP